MVDIWFKKINSKLYFHSNNVMFTKCSYMTSEQANVFRTISSELDEPRFVLFDCETHHTYACIHVF